MGARSRQHYAFGTVGWVIAQYRQSPEYRRLREGTKRTYEQAFEHLYQHRDKDIRGLRRRHVLLIRDQLSDTPAVANNVLAAIRRICRYALDLEVLETDPTTGVQKLRLGEWQRWTDDEIAYFYQRTYEALRRAMVLAIYTGQRRADLCRMTWADWQGSAIRAVQQKTGARLWLPVHPGLAEHLRQWRRDAATVTILASSDRRPWNPGTLSRAWSNELRRLEMPGCTIHGLRKTAAAKLAEAGCSTKEIAAVTGHASLQEIERYTREAEQVGMAEQAIARLAPLPFEATVKPLSRNKK